MPLKAVLANLDADLKTQAQALRGVLTTSRVLDMLNVEQAGNWCDRAYNKSGELKYILPATQEMYGKVWPFIYALQGSNRAHREYFVRNRFALLDAKYGTSNFTSDNIDLYLARTAADTPDVLKIHHRCLYGERSLEGLWREPYEGAGYERGRRPPEKRFRPGQMYRAARTEPSKFRQRQYRLVVEHRQLQAAT